MADIATIAALYLLWESEERRKRKRRRVWVHDILRRRPQLGEFHHLLQELRLDDGRFQLYFRLSRAQFDDLLARVGARISRQDTNYRRSISAAERLSICLRFLATGDSFRTIATSFRVGPSTVASIVSDGVTAIWDCLVEEFMAVPTTEDWRVIAQQFEEQWNFPLCCGAIDGKHVALKAPANSGSQFFNYKGTFSIVLLAVVDADKCFRIIDVGGYGRTTDEALPLRTNLMTPFPGRILPRERRVFNYRLSRARLVVENAFGILSSQWRIYRRVIEVRPEQAEIWLGRVAANNAGREAIRIRETFTSYFSAEGTLSWHDSIV
ncbi:uncharacterized protein LOC130404233 [Gadus chalcogrammus]|uniref:uncharacterized protein LOC130404233 n=1 Tax=Gadus chalcogrammus TaxID=1042646 RepID=UPI0024C4D91A|nr:uncharacterized protein LOC130404233 [Gadus chalcogrammus]